MYDNFDDDYCNYDKIMFHVKIALLPILLLNINNCHFYP